VVVSRHNTPRLVAGLGKGKGYVDSYSALDDKHFVLKALRHGSHSLTCKEHHACL